jgi:hypothetical protein
VPLTKSTTATATTTTIRELSSAYIPRFNPTPSTTAGRPASRSSELGGRGAGSEMLGSRGTSGEMSERRGASGRVSSSDAGGVDSWAETGRGEVAVDDDTASVYSVQSVDPYHPVRSSCTFGLTYHTV